MTDSAATTATANTIPTTPTPQLGGTTSEVQTENTSTFVPPQYISPKDAKTDSEEDLDNQLKAIVAESLEAHRIASEATVKMLQRNVELDASASANLSGADLGSASDRPGLFSDAK